MIASKDKFHFWVGMTIVIVIAIFIGLLCTVFTPNYFRPKTVVETYFTESVNGLSPGAPVKFKGIDIGKVTDISLSSKVYPEHHIGLFSPDSSVAVVRMIVYLDEDQLKKQLPSLIQNGLRFQTELAGVTGTIYLAANFLNPTLYPPEIKDVPWKPRYLYVPATISLTNEILENIQNFLATLQNLKAKIDDVTPGAVKSQTTKELLTTLNHTVSMLDPDKLRALLSKAENYINSSHAILSTVDVARINSLLSQLSGTTAKLNETLKETKGSGLVTQLNKTISSADQAIVDNRYNIRELILNLKDISDNLKILSENLEQDPNFLTPRTHHPSPIGSGK